MVPATNKYRQFFPGKTVLTIALALGFVSLLQAQNKLEEKSIPGQQLNPLLFSSFKKPVKPATDLNERFKRPTNQLMSWPNYPLTAQQIMQRDRKYDQPIGKQILNEMAESYINSLLNGRNKKTVAVRPRF